MKKIVQTLCALMLFTVVFNGIANASDQRNITKVNMTTKASKEDACLTELIKKLVLIAYSSATLGGVARSVVASGRYSACTLLELMKTGAFTPSLDIP